MFYLIVPDRKIHFRAFMCMYCCVYYFPAKKEVCFLHSRIIFLMVGILLCNDISWTKTYSVHPHNRLFLLL
jgi:hypothetical protein